MRHARKLLVVVASLLVLAASARYILLYIPSSLTSPTDPYRADQIWGVYNSQYLANGGAPYTEGDQIFAWYQSGVSEQINVQYVNNGQLGFVPSGVYGRWKSPNQNQAGWGGACNAGGGYMTETGYWQDWEVCTSGAPSCTTGSSWVTTGYRVYPEVTYHEECPV